ncbi:NBAS subunit of NRZ tethering complex-like [Clavelina lepadiformis]|uniref:NBAS subunit of NRZ tethering complex-like n=1 Tax=Clavelina lepadiformis TaxID=159417 RepID=UPI004042162C
MSEKLLYDIVHLLDWPQEKEVKSPGEAKRLANTLFKAGKDIVSTAAKRAWGLLHLAGVPQKQLSLTITPDALIQLKIQKNRWACSISPCGKIFIIAQSNLLETWLVDDISEAYGSYKFSELQVLHQAKLAWTNDSSIFAVSLDQQKVHVFDTKCKSLVAFDLAPPGSESSSLCMSDNICSMIFMETRNDNKDFPWELLILTYSGLSKIYFISPLGGFELYHEFNFGKDYVYGISSAFIDESTRVLIIGGSSNNFSKDDNKITASKVGITRWRILSDYPFYKSLPDEVSTNKDKFRPGLLRRISSLSVDVLSKLYSMKMNGIYAMALSPDHTKLAAIHFAGVLSFWSFPSMKLTSKWSLENQPCYDQTNPSMASRFGKKKKVEDQLGPFPFDIAWWNDDALIISRCSGGLTIVTVKDSSLVNLFGEQCEWIAPHCKIASTLNEKFYILECIIEVERSATADNLHFGDTDEKNAFHNMMEIARSWVGMEEKYVKDRVHTRKYCLSALTKTTPEELYERKLDDKEFGEALSIAQAYNLDCDKVFQRRWKISPVSRATIQDYLGKVQNLMWVFRECTDRVPDTIDDTKELFSFALRVTDLDKMAKLVTSDVDPDEEEEDDDIEDYDGFDYEEQCRREKQNRIKYEEKWFAHVDFNNLTHEQSEMLKCRQKMLRFQDRLATYQLLLGGYDAASERFNGHDFATFRRRDMFHLALEHIRSGNWKAIEILFEYHYDQLHEHRLSLLSNFSETLSPNKYQSLLPFVVDEKVVVAEKRFHQPHVDWCEKLVSFLEKPDTGEFYETMPELAKFRASDIAPSLLSDWYHTRAMQMEKLSCQTHQALQLVDIGIENGVPGLSKLRLNLSTLDNLLYECGCDLSMTLEKLLLKTPLEQIHLMMEKSSSDSFIQDLQQLIIPFVKANGDVDLLISYLVETSKSNLLLPSILFKYMSTHNYSEFLFNDQAGVINASIDCIYAMEEASELHIAYQILNALPKMRKKLEVVDLEKNLNACAVFEKHQIPMTPTQLKAVSEDNHQVLLLYKRLTRTLAYHEEAVTKSKCDSILQDMKSITTSMFSSIIDEVTCIRVLIEGLLTSGSAENIRLAGDMMVRSRHEESKTSRSIQLPYEESTNLVLSASKEYFDAASVPLNDNKLIKLSRLCLLLMTDLPAAVQQQLNLIEAVVLLNAFEVEMLPLEVRICKDRLLIVQKVLNQSPSNYAKVESVLRLSSLLNVADGNLLEQKGKTITLIVKKAIQSDDLKIACDLVMGLIGQSYTPAWELCVELGTHKKVEDLTFKYNCIAFASCHCEESYLLELSCNLRKMTAALLEQRLEEQITELEELEENEAIEADSAAHALTSAGLGAKTLSTLKTSAGLLTATVNTTGAILGGFSQWSTSLAGLPSLSTNTNEVQIDHAVTGSDNNELYQQGCPAFYLSIIPTPNVDESCITYTSYGMVNKLAITHVQTQLRINMLADMEDRAVENIVDIAQKVLPNDLTLGLAYLLSLSDVKLAQGVLEKFTTSSISLQLLVYYHALQVIQPSFPSIDSCSPVYGKSPMHFIDHMLKYAVGYKHTDALTELETATFLLMDYIQGEKLRKLGYSIDVQRCLSDAEYLEETACGLAMSADEDQFFLGILLAEQGYCDLWPVVATHVEYLFTDSKEKMVLNELFIKLRKLKLLDTLISKDKDLFVRFDERVFPLIDGCDHDTLLCYFSLFKECNWSELEQLNSVNSICKLSPQAHIRNLRKIMSCAPNLDYKCLITENASDNILNQIKQHINETNRLMFTQLIPKIPYQSYPLTASSVLLCWSLKQFWRKDADADYMKRLESCAKWLQQLNADDVRSFFEDILYSERSLNEFSYGLRHKFLKYGIKFVKKQKENNKLGSEEVTKFKELFERYNQLNAHFIVFTEDYMKSVMKRSHSDEHWKEFLIRFDKSRSEDKKVLPLVIEMVNESVEETCLLLQCLRNTKITLIQVIESRVIQVVQDIRNACSPEDVKKAFASMEKLLNSIKDFAGKEKKDLFNAVVTLVQTFCEDSSINVQLKIDALQLLQKTAALSEHQTKFLLHHRTAELMKSGWGDQLAENILKDIGNISDISSQEYIVNSLLGKENTLEQLNILSNIIDLLENNSTQPRENEHLWHKLLQALTERGVEGGNLTVSISKRRKFSEKVVMSVFDQLKSKLLVLAAVKFSLNAEVPANNINFKEMLKQVERIDSTTCDDEMIGLLLEKNIVQQTLSTLYYHHVVQYLISGRCENAEEKINQLVRQLQDNGHISEAATLLLRYKGSHSAFATFGNSIVSISNWLNRF